MAFYAIYNIISNIVLRYRYKNNFRVELLLFTKHCHEKKNGEDACDGAYFMNFLDDSEFLDFGSAFKHCLSVGTCAMIKNNTLSIFMLSGSIQFSIPFQFNRNQAFIKIMPLYNVFL